MFLNILTIVFKLLIYSEIHLNGRWKDIKPRIFEELNLLNNSSCVFNEI